MIKKRKLLFVTSYLDSGGAERWLFNTLSAMALPKEVEIDSYYFRGVHDDLLIDGYEKLGVNLSFRNLDIHGRVREVLSLSRDLKRYIRKNGPYQAIHVNGTPLFFQALILHVARRCGVKLRIAHVHGSESSKLGCIGSLVRNMLRKLIHADATLIAACSDQAAQIKYGPEILRSPKYLLMCNGIDLSKFQFNDEYREQVRRELGIAPHMKMILHIGRFSPEKNHHFLLDCFEQLYRANPDMRLVLIGKGILRKEIEESIARKQLSDVVSLIDHTDYPEMFYSAADCFVLPSLHEGLAYVSIESLACGCPVVMSDKCPVEPWRTGLVTSLSLESGPFEWANAISARIVLGRMDCYSQISQNGYDLTETSEEFLRYLLEGEKED